MSGKVKETNSIPQGFSHTWESLKKDAARIGQFFGFAEGEQKQASVVRVEFIPPNQYPPNALNGVTKSKTSSPIEGIETRGPIQTTKVNLDKLSPGQLELYRNSRTAFAAAEQMESKGKHSEAALKRTQGKLWEGQFRTSLGLRPDQPYKLVSSGSNSSDSAAEYKQFLLEVKEVRKERLREKISSLAQDLADGADVIAPNGYVVSHYSPEKKEKIKHELKTASRELDELERPWVRWDQEGPR